MSVFKTQCFLFLRNPRGGVEDLDRMQAAGFQGVFCNIGDYPEADWEAVIRPRAIERGMFCGPWLRTEGSQGGFDVARLTKLTRCADRWRSPLVCNSEKEIDHSGNTWTSYIADTLQGYDAALSVEAMPFASVDWWPVREIPVLPQIFPAESAAAGDPEACAHAWHDYGIECVFFTFGAYGGMAPGDFDLRAPYSVYTADDMGGNYAAWSPRTYGYEGCIDTNGGDVAQIIGDSDGIAATFNRLRDLDPAGTLLVKDAKGKWPPLSTLQETPVESWKAYDKGQRSLQILADDHDAALGHTKRGEDDDG